VSAHRLLPVPLAAALLLAGCQAGGSSQAALTTIPAASTTIPATPAPDGADVPVPGSTLAPDPTADARTLPDGLVLAVVVPEAPDETAATLSLAVDRWAADRGVAVERHVVTGGDELQGLVDSLVGAGGPTIVVAPGAALLDELDSVSPQNLGTHFLLLGAQLVEPTANVTAVVWSASDGGSRAPADGAAFTADRSDEAVAAGVANVLAGVTGVVVHLDA
jgi:hypothetical protein